MGYLESFDSVFWITAGTLVIGVVGLCIRTCFKSKCSRVKICWSFLDIERNTADEIPDPPGTSVRDLESGKTGNRI